MTLLREIVAVLVFVIACSGVMELVVDGFSWATLGLVCFLFWLAWWIWPSKRKGQRSDDNRFMDILEIVIELPLEMLLWLLRLFGRLFKDADTGIDL